MTNNPLVIGVDYGTDSVRSILIDAITGQEKASSVFYYPRWKKGLYCNARENLFRQHPLDYIEGLEHTIKSCIDSAGPEAAANVKAISIDTTGSTPVAVDSTGAPLALIPAFEHNPNAMFVLWKDHTSVQEAAAINNHAKKFNTNYLQYVGGIYSSEWFWAKLLHILKEDEAVRLHTASWVEHCDWIPFLLTGGHNVTKMKRSICSAGHKALWAEAFGGFPPNEFFATLDPLLDGFTAKLFTETFTSDKQAGIISAEWAGRLGLPADVHIGVGAFDAHMGAVGGQIEPYYLSKVMGTSTCDMLVAPSADIDNRCVQGICGQVNGSILPGMIGLEAGQSAFGDVYAWFGNLLQGPAAIIIEKADFLDEPTREKLLHALNTNIIKELETAAAGIEPNEDMELAIDWLNGRRTPDANQLLKGTITNLQLGSSAPQLFYALAEATCFGAKAIADRFIEQGIPVKGLIGLGGVAKKSPFIMQMMSDVMNMPIKIHKSDQTCAVGAAMFAATVAGIYATVEEAMQAMGTGFDANYTPNTQRVDLYQKRYEKYKMLGAFLEANLMHS